MSLINEALKKAQRQRTDVPPFIAPAAAAPADSPRSPRVVKRRPPMPARALMLLLVGGGLVLVTAGVVTFVLFNLDSTPVIAVKSALGHRPKPVPPVAVTPAIPTVTLPAIPGSEVTPPPPPQATTPIPVPAPVPAPVVIEKPAPIVVVPPPSVPVVKTSPPPAPKPLANPAINTFIEALRITGVRLSGRDSKVIMNDRIVRLNDYVDRTLGLRFTKIIDAAPDHASSLVFTDENGCEYTKPL